MGVIAVATPIDEVGTLILRPAGLRLWTFESNLGAQRFYERHGFRPIERTAGDNEEGAPDILYVWGAS